ncbi:hypothetical protein [Qipengyuania aquimaris]|uniref:hypothetical protein n=1 Tax=Qipengyuania aquimaris TaxID=255984 RepID=UPI001FD488CA|nr:hypothetical protein [Qipengyuania aquimaris]UOR16352.1 hypothetical protein LCM05_04730 [Qipengyuania aquimaris]
MRATFIGLLVITGLCAAMLYGVSTYFGRDANMRSAELAFHEKHGTKALPAGRPMKSDASVPRRNAPEQTDTSNDLDAWYGETADDGGNGAPATTSSKDRSDLDSWYAAAGSNDGPADTTPPDNSYLVNDTEPFVTTDPL